MKIQRSLWLALGALAGVITVVAQVSGQTAPTIQKLGTATISGRITLGEKPAGGVMVGLLKAEPSSSEDMAPVQRAMTDSDGRYRMMNVVAGRFRLQAMAPGFVTEEQKREIFSMGQVLNLNDGETIENMDFKLTKGGVITGKVTDADGRPLIAARLQLFQVQADGRKQQAPMTSMSFMMMQTDDRGEYRLYGLLEGRYVIGASPGFSAASQPATYHPNTSSQDEAAIVNVTPGSESRDIDIRLSGDRRKTFNVTARVVEVETGQPVSGVMISYRALKAGGSNVGSTFSISGMSDARGIVRLDNLAVGRYGADISSFARMEGQNSDYYSEMTPFEITDSDIESLEIRAHRGIAVSGVAVIDGITDPTMTANLFAQIGADGATATSRSATPGSGGIIYPHYFKINRDGTFRVGGLSPGTLSISLNPRSARGFMFVRVETDKLNERGEAVLTAGQPLTGVRVVLAYGTAVIRGDAQIVNGTLPADARTSVSLRRADAPRTGGGGLFAQVDARGRFVLEGVPAGEYELTLSSFSRSGMTMVTIGSDGTTTTTNNNPNPTPPRPLMARQKIIVPASGEVPVTITLDVAAQQNPPKE